MLVKCLNKHICFHAVIFSRLDKFSLLRQIRLIWSTCCRDPQRRHIMRNQFSLIFWDKGAWCTIKTCTHYVYQHMTAHIYTSMTPKVFRKTQFFFLKGSDRGWRNAHEKPQGTKKLTSIKKSEKKKRSMIWFNIWMCHCFPCRAQEWYKNTCKTCRQEVYSQKTRQELLF